MHRLHCLYSQADYANRSRPDMANKALRVQSRQSLPHMLNLTICFDLCLLYHATAAMPCRSASVEGDAASCHCKQLLKNALTVVANPGVHVFICDPLPYALDV